MKLKDFRPIGRHRKSKNKKKDYYIEKGIRVYKGTKLDKAIQSYRKKGYYCTEPLSDEIANCGPTLRPSFFGTGAYARAYHHPLIREPRVVEKKEDVQQ